MPQIRLLDGQAVPTFMQLDGRDVIIGRTKDCTIRILGNSASRNHCKLTMENGRWAVMDLKSSNGTFVNNERIEKRPLDVGDRVVVGEAVFVFEVPEAPKLMGKGDTKPMETRRLTAPEAPPPTPLSSIPVDLHFLVDAVLGVGLDQLRGERCALALYNDHGDGRILWSQGFPDDPLKEAVNPVRKVMEKAKSLGKAIVVSGADDPRSRLCAPIMDQKNIIGAIYVDAAIPYTKDHLAVLKIVAARLEEPIRMALNYRDLRSRLAMTNMELELNRMSPGAPKRLGNLIGRSKAMEQVFSLIKKGAPTDSCALIEGEPGTGKEFVARAIHDLSPRAARPFIVVNCEELSPTEAEGELFGHSDGAGLDQPGLFVQAHGGTIFLNEVGGLTLDLQEKIRHVLRTGEILPLGGTERVPVEVRLIAGTSLSLDKRVQAGQFDAEFHDRLGVLRAHLVPLRERPDDIPLLAHQFLRDTGGSYIKELSPEALRGLLRHPWPGNILELKGVVERLCDLSEDPVITDKEVETVLSAPDTGSSTLLGFKKGRERTLERYEREFLQQALMRRKGNLAEIARDMGIERKQVQRMAEKYRLKPEEFRK